MSSTTDSTRRDEPTRRERLIKRTERVTMVTVGVLLVATNGALAQVDDVGQAMCGVGLGQLVTFLFAAIALLLIIKSAFMGMLAFDKFNSPREQEHFEGTKQMKSAGWTFLGAFVPLIFGAALDVLGVNTVSCLDFDIGILGIALEIPTFVPFF